MRELSRRLALPRGALAVAGLAMAVLALPAPTAAAPARPSYSVTTAGAAVQVVSTQKPAFSIATGDLVDQTVGLVASDFGSSTSEARAASYYPGDLIAQAGQLICGQFGPCPFEPPAYPLLAEASWPTVQHATAGHGVATSSAAATATGNTAASSGAAGPSGGLSVGSISSVTSTEARSDGLHVHVLTTLQDVGLGPLSVAGIRVSDDVLVRPDGSRSANPHVAVSGATVAGTPVELGSTPLPSLAQQGLVVRVVGASTTGARSGAVGLRIDVSVPVKGVGAPLPGLPSVDRTYVGSYVLGQVSVVAARDESLDLPLPPLPSPPIASTVTLPPGRTPPVASLPGSAPGPAPAGPVTVPSDTVVVTRSFGLDDLDLTDLYAVIAIGAVVGLLVSRTLSRRAWRGSWEGAVP